MGFIMLSCTPESDHSIRIKNDYAPGIRDFMIGTVSYGNIEAHSITGYKPVEAGSHKISGDAVNGNKLSGTVTIRGKGSYKWTITIPESGNLAINRD